MRPGNTWDYYRELTGRGASFLPDQDVSHWTAFHLRAYDQQAQRDLRDLTTAAVLVPVGRTRARYYTPGTRSPQQALEIAGTPMTLTDPYAPWGRAARAVVRWWRPG